MSLHPLLARLFEHWEREGVRWCLLRPTDLAVPEGDIDLLLAPASLEAARRAAFELGFVQLPGRHQGTHLLQYDKASACWLWLHAVGELTFGPWRALPTGAADGCLARRLTAPVPRLAPGDEFWVSLLHGFLDKGTVAAGRREALRGLSESASADGELPAALAPLLPAGWTAAGVVAAVKVGDWDGLDRLAAKLARRAAAAGRPAMPRRVARAIAGIRERVTEWRGRRGISVALLGPDGAGKSTLAEGLRSSFVFPVREVYMGLTGGMLRYVDKLRIPGVVRLGRLAVIWARYLRAQYHVARGRLVVFDRYIYDADVPPPYALGPIGRFTRWMDGRACPGPDIVIVLDAPGAVMHQRKGEYDPDTLKHWRGRFLALQRRVPGLEVVDTTGGAEAVRRDVLDRIWRRYADRWRIA